MQVGTQAQEQERTLTRKTPHTRYAGGAIYFDPPATIQDDTGITI
jgi:hypothetical protein